MQKKLNFFIYIIIVIVLVIYSPLVTSVEAVRYDPGLNWQVLESPHFSVYFSKLQNNEQNDEDFSYNNEQLAQEVADIAEETYHQVNAQLGSPNKHHHLQKIAIIMEDFSDYALGFASSFPHRVIRLSLTAPTAKSFDMKFESWLKMVITHEYTHLAHFEMTSGPTTALRALFGQILTPNALQPIWSTEGLAVYNETKFTAGGRGVDARYDMYLRMATLENQFNTLDQINGYYLTSWPDGTAPYIYGQSLVHFIAQKYGEDKIITMSEIFCEYPYLGFNYAVKRAIGLNLEELYQSWKENLKEKYQLQTQKILSQKNLTPSQQLTEYHYWVDYPHWFSTPEGDKIAVRVSTPHSYPFIQIIDPLSPSLPSTPRSTKNEPLIRRIYGRDSSFSLSVDGSKIIYAKLDDYEQFYNFYDLYLFDLKTEKETRLSEGLRARDPSWSPDPKNPQIVAVINQSGTNNLALINLPSPNSSINEAQPTYKLITKEDITYLTDFHDGTQLYQPSWSPKGDRIAFSAWRQGYQDIYILNLDPDNLSTNNLNPGNIGNFTLQPILPIQPIFQDKSIDLSPCWSPDGQYLFFTSDRTGIYNIFAFSLPDKKLYQVTNVLGGAFQPAISPDGTQLAFISYHATGYELHLMKVDPNSNPNQWTEIKIEYVELPIMVKQPFNKDLNTSSNSNSKNNYPIHPYHPLTSFWPPTYWIPAVRLTESDLGIGFSTKLEDVLGFYSLPLSVTYGIFNNSLSYNFNYYNYRYLPIVNLYLSGNAVLNSPTSWWEEGKTGINIYFPFNGQTASTTNSRPYRQIFSLGYQYEKFSSATSNALSLLNTDPQKTTSLKLGYSYSDAEKYGFSISPEIGNSFSLTYEHADKALGGDYTFDKLIFDGRKFIPLPLPSSHQVLALRLVAGIGSSSILESDLDGEKFKLGGNYSADNLSNTEVNAFSLRGYKPATLEGNNLILASLEYRFPLANIEHSLKFDPFSIFLERLSGAFFIDIGNAWESAGVNKTNEENEINSIWQDFKSSIGAELKADFNQKYDSPFTLRLGAAKALTDPKGYDIYITLGTSF
ncbi:MAG: PD40 domain-containing protein, partial [Candidatus Atribacteria bacterium]|nr:PD40 domain-containing protein [Candidatus Atribacteria bacterium]